MTKVGKYKYRSSREKPIPDSIYKEYGENKCSQIFDFLRMEELFVENIPYTDYIKLHRKSYICEIWKFERAKIAFYELRYASQKILET